jgi:hypothetical protein
MCKNGEEMQTLQIDAMQIGQALQTGWWIVTYRPAPSTWLPKLMGMT